MQHQYETPELTRIGEAEEVVLGSGMGGDDFPKLFEPAFEFEHD
jgi:hypothetical protein